MPLHALCAGLLLCVLGRGAAGLEDALQLLQLPRGWDPFNYSSELWGADGERGYFYDSAVDGRDSRSYLAPDFWLLREPTGPAGPQGLVQRAVFLAGGRQGLSAMDDVKLKLKMTLMLGVSLGANVAVDRPNLLLGGMWGSSTTHSWSTYVASMPRIWHFDEIKCDPAARILWVKEPRFLDVLDEEGRRDVLDPSRPLCLVLDFLIFRLRPEWKKDDEGKERMGVTPEWELLMKGKDRVALWQSSGVSRLMSEARQQWPELHGGGYNALHARRGDFKNECTSPERVVRHMLMTDPTRPWLVMSNGEPEWYADFNARVQSAGLRIVTEKNLTSFEALDDNFLKYQALQCLFSQARHQIAGTKALHTLCHAPGQPADPQSFEVLCRLEGPSEHRRVVGNSGTP